MSDYYLPQEIAKLLTDDRLKKCKNLGLILDKYPPQSAVQKSERKSDWLKEIKPESHIDQKLAAHAYQRWLRAIEAIHALHFDARTDWRMVVGLGGETVLETDLTLHHVYGIPFIPGSALKGLTRAYVTGGVYKSDKIENDNAEVQRIFGTQEKAGSVIFFDAMPLDGKCSIELDIMNAHYPDYYGKGDAPTNDQNPNPVTFLTVTNTTFTFALAPRRADDPQHKNDVGLVQGWLQKALQEYGIGGKTSAGYGYLTVVGQAEASNSTQQQQVETKATPVDPEMNRVQGYIQELQNLRNSDVAGRINGFYQRWQQTQSNEARIALARAIVEKVRQAGREKASADKAWYKELQEFLDKVK